MTNRGQSPLRPIAVTLAAVMVAIAAVIAGQQLASFRQAAPISGVTPGATASASATPKRVTLPQPVPQPITRTSPAAQVAWVSLHAANTPTVLVGVDQTGKIVGRVDGMTEPFVNRTWRSRDGAALVTIGDPTITVYSALDGSVQRTYDRAVTDGVLDVAFSPDSRRLALIGSTAYVQVIDLRSGLSQTTPLGHDARAQTPGLSRPPGSTGLVWSTLVFAPDSKRLYTIVDWAGPLRLTAFDVTATGLVQTATAIDRQGGASFPSCAGPGLAPRVTPDGRTLMVFCHVDGALWFIDLPTMSATAVVMTVQPNPFWLSPLFTPDGHLVYLRQNPGFTDTMQVVDVATHALAGPVPTPKKLDEPGPFSWLFGQVALAGGVASTVPISPDGLRLYMAAGDGVTVLRVPDLKPIAKLAKGLNLNEVWISGDGKTLFGTTTGASLYVIPDDGSQPTEVILPSQIGGFIASEHG